MNYGINYTKGNIIRTYTDAELKYLFYILF